MPVTKGHGNPDWTREETILALDLLYRHGKPLERRHPEVKELSDFLRSAAIHSAEFRRESFRNPDGVALKLQNLLSATEPGRGLSYSTTDIAVATDFPRNKAEEVRKIAASLRACMTTNDAEPTVAKDEIFVEGAWLTARHRQRDARLRKRLLAKAIGTMLKCEICGFEPPPFDRPTQESFFEAHHRVPLAEAETTRATRLDDMALLCACCHRYIHRLISNRRMWVSVEGARALLRSTVVGSQNV